MDFIDRIRELSVRIPKQLDHIQTEEATKHALVMPFISALGYNPFDPTEVTPELNADVGTKKGEKVDYAILKDGKPIVLFECKWHGTDLSKVGASQLYRYFSVTEARFGVLTNGILYWFYTDLEAPNKMDAKPFFEFNMLDVREQDVEELKKFTKSAFDLTGILTTASELKYTREMKRILVEQMQDPSVEFVRFFASQVYSGKFTQTIREQFAQITRRALKQFINDQINERLKSALVAESPRTEVVSEKAEAEPSQPVAAEPTIVTTDEEREAFYIIKAILREVVDPKRIAMRDVQSYCGILLDDNNRKPICRLRFYANQKFIGLFDNEARTETRVPIAETDEIYKYADRLIATVALYKK
ncbi:MAG: type I restriction endonuclease [Chloroflexota bacterium]